MPPDKLDKAYKYLGVLLTLTLNWSHQFKPTMATAVEQACKLQSLFTTPAQKLQVYRSKIVAAMRYVFSTTAFSPLDIKMLAAAMTCVMKDAIGLMGCTRIALLHEDISKGGLGMTSLLHPYVQEQTNTIVKCLHGDGRLGSITKHMLMK